MSVAAGVDDCLVYYPDDRPGITRRRCGRGFAYRAADGTTIARGAERTRLEAMAVPPAYREVWMSPLSNGHLMATGRDARGRKQYRYHPDWQAARSETKFALLPEFARALPAMRRRVARDLEAECGARDFALAAAVALLDRLALRVGHPAYTRENGSFGLVTLRPRHVRLGGHGVGLSFRAKGGAEVRARIDDRRLQKVLQKARDLPGAELLTWVDGEGGVHALTSQGVNAYIAELSGEPRFTAKVFRTWAGTLAGFQRVLDGPAGVGEIAGAAAERLANTPAVARSSYVHPAVLDLAGVAPPDLPAEGPSGLYAGEKRLLQFLERA
ncbi:DNA topoisomerase IB [Aquicoccus sp. SCR17]|nr:DNA topoisomerase IB [Carideicomes alvinocaridis]